MVGQTLGHYRVIEMIGAGGMGEVYRAHDKKLGREVAVKVLPSALARDPERLTRFQREAQFLASLNHPNIAAIYGFEEVGGARFLVLELVPGETLAQRLASGSLPIEEALRICREIAVALEAAHEKGIVHRDLKPANVKITPEGTVKVLDFGLAKAVAGDDAANDPACSPTLTVGGTREGVIHGTAAYMSPEQARGKKLDKRTDIWSFGCLLYESLTGHQVFAGETGSDAIAKILEREPDWKALPENAPARIRDLLKRCLQKDSSRRLRDIGDARLEIEEALAEPRGPAPVQSGTPSPSPVKATPRRLVTAIALASFLAGVLVTVWAVGRGPRAQESAAPAAQLARLTHDPGVTEWPTWSRDGRLLAFASNRSGNFQIYVRQIEGGRELNVTSDPAQDIQPAFSPDGTTIAFVSTRSSRTGMIKIGGRVGSEIRTYGGDVWLAPALGGPARRLAEDGNSPAWQPSGSRVAYISGPENHRSILEASTEGGAPKALLPSESSSWEIVRIQYTPDGSWISFDTDAEQIFVMPATGGSPRRVADGFSHAWDETGRRLYFLTREPLGGSRLQYLEVDEGTKQPHGDAHVLSLTTATLDNLAISPNGQRLAFAELEGSLNLARLPLRPGGDGPAGAEEVLTSGRENDHVPSVSPDGKQVAFSSDRLGSPRVWTLDLETRRLEALQLPGNDLRENDPHWSPDGRRLAITRDTEAGITLWLVAADESRAEQLLPPTPGLDVESFSPDGRRILLEAKASGFAQFFIRELASGQEHQLTFSPSEKYDAAWSPDGRWIAFTSAEVGSTVAWRMPASGGAPDRLTASPERLRHIFYSPDGRWLYLQPSHQNIYRIPASGGALQRVTNFPESGLFIEEPTLSPDGRDLVYCRWNGGSSLWMLKLGGNLSGKP